MWNVRSLYRSRNKLHLLGVQEVRWDKGGTLKRGLFLYMEQEVKIITC